MRQGFAMNRPYVLDHDGLDGVSNRERPDVVAAEVEQLYLPVELDDLEKIETSSNSLATKPRKVSRILITWAAIVLVGVLGLMYLGINSSDIKPQSVPIVRQSEILGETNGPNPELGDKIHSVSETNLKKHSNETDIDSSIEVAVEKNQSAALSPIQKKLPVVGKQANLTERSQPVTDSNVANEIQQVSLGNTVSEDTSSTSGIPGQTVNSTDLTRDKALSEPLETSEFILQFGFNVATVNGLPKSTLHGLKDFADNYCLNKVRVVGHTCNVGRLAANLDVGRIRADSVKNLLVEFGLSTDRIEVFSAGEKSPIASNSTRSGRTRNRRVVVECMNHSE